jgi:hypothetical protein
MAKIPEYEVFIDNNINIVPDTMNKHNLKDETVPRTTINLEQDLLVPPNIEIAAADEKTSNVENNFFVTQLHMEPSKCLLLRLPKVTLKLLQDIGPVKSQALNNLVWQLSFWRNGFRVTPSLNVDVSINSDAKMIIFENIGKDTNQIRCVLKYIDEKSVSGKDSPKRYKRNADKNNFPMPSAKESELYEADIEIDKPKISSWGGSAVQSIGLGTKKFIRIITFHIKNGISLKKRRSVRVNNYECNEENNSSSTNEDVAIFRIGVDIKVAATTHIVSHSGLFVNFFSKLVNDVLAGEMHPTKCIEEYLHYTNRTNVNVAVSCQTYVFIILSSVYKSSIESSNHQQVSFHHDWIYPLLATSLIENMKRASLSRDHKLFIIAEFWRVIPDMMIVETINHFFRIVSQIQHISYPSFVNETTAEDEFIFQALYVLSSILTAGALSFIVERQQQSGKINIITSELIDEFLTVCSKITLRAYQICGDALVSYIDLDDDPVSSPQKLKKMVNRHKKYSSNKHNNGRGKDINCNILFLILSSILGLGLQSDTVLNVTSNLMPVFKYLDTFDFHHWLEFFLHVLQNDHYSNEYKEAIASVVVGIFHYVQKNKLLSMELSSLPSMSELLIKSRSITIMHAYVQSLLSSSRNLHVWVNTVTFLQLVDDENYKILETCQKHNDGTTVIFVESVCNAFIKNLETVGIGNESENVLFATQILPLWTNESAMPPILVKENALIALCNFIELFVPSAYLDAQNIAKLVQMKNAVLLSLLKWGGSFVVDLFTNNNCTSTSLKQLKQCYKLVKLNLLGLQDSIDENVINECLETLHFIIHKQQVPDIPINDNFKEFEQLIYGIVVSLYQYPSSNSPSSVTQMDIEEKKRYKILFRFFENKCSKEASGIFIPAFVNHVSLSSNKCINTFVDYFLQLHDIQKTRDKEIQALVRLASIWMACYPPGAIRYLEQLIELKDNLRNDKKSVLLIVALIDTINSEYKCSVSPNFLFFKTQYSCFEQEYKLATLKAREIFSKYKKDVRNYGHNEPIGDDVQFGASSEIDECIDNSCKLFAVRYETPDDVTWAIRYGKEGMTYHDFLLYLHQIYPSALIISAATPRRMKKKLQTMSLLNDEHIIQVFSCRRMEKEVYLNETRDYSVYINVLNYEENLTMNNGVVVQSSSGPHHSPKKHSNYGKSLTEWHVTEDSRDGTIVKCIFTSKDDHLLENLFGVKYDVCQQFDVDMSSCKEYSATDACIEWLKERFHVMKHLYHVHKKDNKSSLSLNNLFDYMASTLDGKNDGEVIDMKTALRIIVYFREWEANYQSNLRKDKKLKYIKLKRAATQEGKAFPRQSIYMQFTPDENTKITDLVLHYTRCRQLLEECYEICSNGSSAPLSVADHEKYIRLGYLLNFNGYARVGLDLN